MQIQKENLEIVEYKESKWYQKIFEKILKTFRKNWLFNKITFDKIKKCLYNKDRKWEPQKCVLPYIFMIKHHKAWQSICGAFIICSKLLLLQ